MAHLDGLRICPGRFGLPFPPAGYFSPQQSIANAEESAAAAQELSSQAEQMRGLLVRFRLEKTEKLPGEPTAAKQLPYFYAKGYSPDSIRVSWS